MESQKKGSRPTDGLESEDLNPKCFSRRLDCRCVGLLQDSYTSTSSFDRLFRPLLCLASRSRSRPRPGPVRRLQAGAPQARSHRRGRRHVPLLLATTTTTAAAANVLAAPLLAMPGTTETGLAAKEPSCWTMAMRKWSSLAQTELAGESAIRITLSIPYADLAPRLPLLSLSSSWRKS